MPVSLAWGGRCVHSTTGHAVACGPMYSTTGHAVGRGPRSCAEELGGGMEAGDRYRPHIPVQGAAANCLWV